MSKGERTSDTATPGGLLRRVILAAGLVLLSHSAQINAACAGDAKTALPMLKAWTGDLDGMKSRRAVRKRCHPCR